MIKKVFISSILVIGLVFPIAKSFAAVPALLLFVAPAAETAFVEWAAGITATAVAGFAAWIMLKDPDKPEQKPITVQIDPNKPLITPQGWTSPTAPPTQSSPETPAKTMYGFNNSSAETACAALAGSGTNLPGCYNSGAPNIANQAKGPYACSSPNNCLEATTTNIPAKCGAGYSLSGGNCNLTTPADVKKPPKGKDEIKRDGNNFIRDPQQNTADNNPNVQVSGNKISYTNDKGEKIEISLNPTTGGATVTHSTPDVATGTTKVNSSDVSPTGAVTGGSQQTYQGTGTQQTNTPAAGVTFPNDYSRAGEAQSAANTLSPKLDQLHTDLTAQTGAADGSGTEPTFGDGLGTTFTGLSAWRLPPHSSICPVGRLSIFGSTLDMDSQCTLLEQVRPTLSATSVAFWMVFALIIVLGA